MVKGLPDLARFGYECWCVLTTENKQISWQVHRGVVFRVTIERVF